LRTRYRKNGMHQNNLIKETNKMFQSNFQVFKNFEGVTNVVDAVNGNSQN